MAKTPAKKPAARKSAAKAKPASRAKSAASKGAAKKPAAKKAPAKRTAAKKAPARKSAASKSTARKSAASKSTARKTTTRNASARKAPARKAAARKPAARKAPARKALARTGVARATKPAQRFIAHHHLEGDFKRDGLRPYAIYRDLGFAEATGGLAQAHVIRLVGPCDPKEVSKLHYHDVDFQMVYVLKGWMKSEFEGQGEQLMRQGTAWIQPPGIKHKVLDYSDDCEVLEIILPAQFDTVTLD